MGEIEEKLVRVLESPEGADVVAAYLFGSTAVGREHRESDVDVAVLLDRNRHPSARTRFERRLELMGRLQAALPGREVEVLSLEDLPPPFARRIVTEGRRIACADVELAHAFVRDVQLKAADLEPFLRRMRRLKLDGLASWTWLVERLAELRRHLDHLRAIRPRVTGRESVCQLVIDVAGELSARRGERFEDYVGAVRNLAKDERFAPDLVRKLERLPGFRNVLVHEYVALDLDRVIEALDDLEPIERFAVVVAAAIREEG